MIRMKQNSPSVTTAKIRIGFGIAMANVLRLSHLDRGEKVRWRALRRDDAAKCQAVSNTKRVLVFQLPGQC